MSMITKNKPNILYLDIPYNFDLKLPEMLYTLACDFENMDYYSIYLPPMPKDETGILRRHQNEEQVLNLSEEEYKQHLDLLNKYFPGKIMLLMQQRDYIMPEDRIMYYHNQYNISKFCVSSLEKAKVIRHLIPEAEIWFSLTAKLMPEDIIKNKDLYKPYFDGIVLFWYPYNKNVNIIRMLPKDFKYLLLANTWCSQKCNGDMHWLKTDLTNFVCPYKEKPEEENSLIPPNDIWFFLPYIYGIKLQDRGLPSGTLIANISAYITKNFYTPDPQRLKKYMLNTYQIKL